MPTDILLPNTLPLLVAMCLLLNTHTGGDIGAQYPFSGGDTNAQYLFWWRHFRSVPILVEAALHSTQYAGDIVARYFGGHLWLNTPSRGAMLVTQYPFRLRH